MAERDDLVNETPLEELVPADASAVDAFGARLRDDGERLRWAAIGYRAVAVDREGPAADAYRPAPGSSPMPGKRDLSTMPVHRRRCSPTRKSSKMPSATRVRQSPSSRTACAPPRTNTSRPIRKTLRRQQLRGIPSNRMLQIHLRNPWGPDGGCPDGERCYGDLWLTEAEYHINFDDTTSVSGRP